MKLLHTSDIHLGLRLCERPMNEDIEHLLDEIAHIAKEEKCDAVILAGDIYDRSNPGAESVAIFDRFVTGLSREGIAILAVSGNHDSPERVAYMSALLEEIGVHLSPVYDGNISPVILDDVHGKVKFWLLPFIRPSGVSALFPEFEGITYNDAVAFAVERMNIDKSERNVLVTHQFVADIRANVEAVGGIGAVSSGVFEGFDYTALGHLHSPHFVGGKPVRYCGSPLKCSFSEVNDVKTVDIVELLEKGNVSIKHVPLHPMREMREIRGTYDEVMSGSVRGQSCEEDYVRIILTDEEDIPDVVQKLRTAYPNMLRLAYDNARTREYRTVETAVNDSLEALMPEDVFAELYELQNNVPPSEEEMEFVKKLMNEIQGEVNL